MLVGSLGVLVVIGVLVSPLSVGVLGENFVSGLECEIAEPQSSLSRKRQASLVDCQGSMSMEDLQKGTLPLCEKEDSRSGLRSRPWVGGCLPSSRKKDVGLFEQQ